MPLAFSLWAADAWQSKPYTEWSDKDVARVVNNSPWAREVRVIPTKPPMSPAGGTSRRQSASEASRDAPMSADTGMRGAPDMSDPASRLERASGTDPMSEMSQTISLIVRWQTALPMRQAQVRLKYGAEGGSSEQAKQFLAQEQNVYVIGVFGLPAVQAGEEQIKREALAQTTLSSKGKPAIRPIRADLNFVAGSVAGNRLMDVYFTFPKTSPFTAADKDVELSTRVDSTPVRCVFHLKDMMFGGDLAL